MDEIRIVTKTTDPLPKDRLKDENTGKAPRMRARQVSPKANAGRPGRILDTTTNVIGMVILKRNMPAMAKDGMLAPKTNNGIDNNNDPIPMRIQPNLSANMPPKPLPNTTTAVKITSKSISDFHGNIMTEPTRDLTATESRTRNRIDPK